eukprot:1446371-Rhodomonas_salina.1
MATAAWVTATPARARTVALSATTGPPATARVARATHPARRLAALARRATSARARTATASKHRASVSAQETIAASATRATASPTTTATSP